LGEIIGHYGDSSGGHGFVYDKGHFTTIDLPGVSVGDTVALGINNAGNIVGTLQNASGVHGFLLTGHG